MNNLSLSQFLSVGATFEGHFETPAIEHQAVAQGKVREYTKLEMLHSSLRFLKDVTSR